MTRMALQLGNSMADRMDALAQLISEGIGIQDAGVIYLGLSRGETARAWANIKRSLGSQAQ